MDIKKVSGNQYLSNEILKNKEKAVKDAPTGTKQDKLQISKEAKVMNEKVEASKLDVIKQKLAQKFYDSDEVLSKVSDKILNELNKK
jgi:galactokinase/mevalonate kinase-like predicted kinase